VRKKVYLILFLLFCAFGLIASEFEITASVDAMKIGMDDTLVYTVRIKGNNNPIVPDISKIDDFKTVQTQRGSEFSIINGMSSYYTNFTFYLLPKKTGTLKIPPVSYNYKGKKYKTRSFEIKVVKGSIKPQNANRRMGNSRLRSFFDNGFDDPFGDPFDSVFKRRPQQKQRIDIFLKPEISKKSVKKGEQIIYTIYLYTRNKITNVSLLSEQSFPGFFQEWKPLTNQIEGRKIEYDGKIYQLYEIRKVALFPTKTGKLKIPSLKFAINLYEPYSFSFSNSRKIYRSTEEIDITSSQVDKNEELPVGSYTMILKVPQSNIDINDILTVKLVISGVGNIKTLPVPRFEPNPYFKVFEPVVKRKTEFTEKGIEGSVVSEMTINFKAKGKILLPSLTMRVFDPKKNEIINLKTKPVHINVTGIKEKTNNSIQMQRELDKTKTDISYIKEGRLNVNKKHYYNLIIFYVLLIIPFLINILYLLKIFIIDKYLINSLSAKKKKFFMSILNKLNSTKEYGDIHSIIEEYFKERSGIGFSELTNESIGSFMNGLKFGKNDIDLVLNIKEDSESAKFSPIKKDGNRLDKDIKDLIRIFKKIESRL